MTKFSAYCYDCVFFDRAEYLGGEDFYCPVIKRVVEYNYKPCKYIAVRKEVLGNEE